jgi:predicted transcriptional regulator
MRKIPKKTEAGIKDAYAKGATQTAIASMFKISQASVSYIVKGVNRLREKPEPKRCLEEDCNEIAIGKAIRCERHRLERNAELNRLKHRSRMERKELGVSAWKPKKKKKLMTDEEQWEINKKCARNQKFIPIEEGLLFHRNLAYLFGGN